MSLETRYRTEIRIPRTQLVSSAANLRERVRPDSPCFDILRKAMEKVVRDRGGVLDQTYSDNEGRKKDWVLAVRTADFLRGIGVSIEQDGRVIFLYDAYGDTQGIGKAICDEVTQNYAVIAVMRAQSKHGFRVRVTETAASVGKKRVVVTGVL